ncbi:MAG TPA: hypothetical protein VHG93_03175 [Longimicrobium sp.]|nr:hypothetical protein [Longimicrobium sp.]
MVPLRPPLTVHLLRGADPVYLPYAGTQGPRRNARSRIHHGIRMEVTTADGGTVNARGPRPAPAPWTRPAPRRPARAG